MSETSIASESSTSNSNAMSLTKVMYGLLGFGLIFPVTAIAAVIMAMVKRGSTNDPLIETHLRYQIRTFWFAALWWAISFCLVFAFFIGYITMLITAGWMLYRVIKGFIKISGDTAEAMY